MSFLNRWQANLYSALSKEASTLKQKLNKEHIKRAMEQNLSEGVSEEDFSFEQISVYGMSGLVTVIAYDPVQGLLALGTNNGTIHIFGKGISFPLETFKPAFLKFLHFCPGNPLLVAIDKHNTLTVFDLTTRTETFSYCSPNIVTSVELVIGTDWLFLGMGDGRVEVVDLDRKCIAAYMIPNLLDEYRALCEKDSEKRVGDSNKKRSEMVTALQIHPRNPRYLLIGYPSAVMLWDVKERNVDSVFELPFNASHPKPVLTVIAWRPDGEHFVAGYEDGTLAFWDMRTESKPIAIRPVQDPTGLNPASTSSTLNEPVYHIAWFAFGTDTSETSLLVAGGSTEVKGLHIIKFSEKNHYHSPKRHTILQVEEGLVDFCVLTRTPWKTTEPLALIFSTATGGIQAFGFDQRTDAFDELQLPSALQWLYPRVVDAKLYTRLPEFDLFIDTTSLAPLSPRDKTPRLPGHLPLTGGLMGHGHTYILPTKDILVTAHADASLRFWDASLLALRPLSHLTVDTCAARGLEKGKSARVTTVEMIAGTGIILLGFENGDVMICYRDGFMRERKTKLEKKLPELPKVELDDSEELIAGAITNISLSKQNELPTELDAEADKSMAKDNSPDRPISITANIMTSQLQLPTEAKGEDDTTQSQENESRNQPAPLEEAAPMAKNNDSTTIFTAVDNAESISGQELTAPENSKKNTWIPQLTISHFSRSLSSLVYPALILKLHHQPISSLTLVGNLLAMADLDGCLSIVDIDNEEVVYFENMNTLEGHDQGDHKEGIEGNRVNHLVTTLGFFESFSQGDEQTACLRLIIGTNHGTIRAFRIVPKSSGYQVHPSTVYQAKEKSRIVYTSIIDLRGNEMIPVEIRASAPTQPARNEMTTGQAKEDDEQPVPPVNSDPAPITATSTKDEGGGKIGAGNEADDGVNHFPASKDNMHRSSCAHEPHYFIICTAAAIRIHLDCSETRLYKCLFKEQPHLNASSGEDGQVAQLIRARLVKLLDESKSERVCLTCFFSGGKVAIYSIPHLKILAESEIPTQLLDGVASSDITPDGRWLIPTGPFEYQQFQLIKSSRISVKKSISLHDRNRALPPAPTPTRSGLRGWLGISGTLSVQELDDILGGPNRPPCTRAYRRTNTYPNRRESGTQPGPRSKTIFEQTTQALHERGQRLNELTEKFEETANASADFAKMARKLREQQEKKKWYEF
ncbi:uncharacterized protein VTP21DRAFT_9833 [Calcarisporiella thermophila]|uniref:uncharacterized protein n=1 Tax=Calcarisporiella thermophila TaxID=911321 RepID=UPI0037424D6B